jgi:hypothetical protein
VEPLLKLEGGGSLAVARATAAVLEASADADMVGALTRKHSAWCAGLGLRTTQREGVSLSVDDTERVQTIDLRERTRDGLIEALYHGSRQTITTDSVKNDVSAYKSQGGYEYSLDRWTYSTSFVVDRSVYNESEGWLAENDGARLTVDFVWWRGSEEQELYWDIDPEKALKVSGPDGELTATSVDHYDEEWDGGEIGRYFTLVFDVPAEALAFDLDFHPKGSIEWREHGVDMPISGDKNHEIAVDFT